MAIFSTRNVRHLFVANTYDATGATPGAFVKSLEVEDGFHLLFSNSSGEVVKSDFIPKGKIRHATALPFVPRVFRQDKLTITNVVAGQDYVIKILFENWGSGSAENQYIKHIGSYKAKTTDDAAAIVDALVALGNLNLSRESGTYLTFAKEAGTNKLVITEVAQPWVLGKRQGRNLSYTIVLSPITVSGIETPEWATIETVKANPGNGNYSQAADLEHFYHAEIGDKYGQVGYPYNFDTTFLVEKGVNYNIIEITYFQTYEGESVQAAEKQLTILCKVGSGVATELVDAINALVPNTLVAIPDSIPGITFDPAVAAFGDVAENTTGTVTINLTGLELPEDIMLAVSGAGFSLDMYNIAKEDAEAEGGQDVVITFAPTAIANYAGTLIVTSGTLQYEIPLTGAGIAGL